MPIVVLRCPQGHEYEDLAGMVVGDSRSCPECGSEGERVFRPGRLRIDLGYDYRRIENPSNEADAGEREMALRHRRSLEQMIVDGKVDGNEVRIENRGPKEFQPFGGEEPEITYV
jgi:hypothetical protein